MWSETSKGRKILVSALVAAFAAAPAGAMSVDACQEYEEYGNLSCNDEEEMIEVCVSEDPEGEGNRCFASCNGESWAEVTCQVN